MREPRRVLSADPVDEMIGEERRLRQARRPIGFGDQRVLGVTQVMSVVGEPGQPRFAMPRQVEADLEAGEYPFVVRQARVGGVGHEPRVDALVGVAEQRRPIAGALRHSGDVVEPVVERGAVADHPIRHLVGAGVERRSTRSARGGLREVVGETDAAGGERIEIRCAHDGVSGAAQGIAAVLVERDQQDVGARHRRATSWIDAIQ